MKRETTMLCLYVFCAVLITLGAMAPDFDLLVPIGLTGAYGISRL